MGNVVPLTAPRSMAGGRGRLSVGARDPNWVPNRNVIQQQSGGVTNAGGTTVVVHNQRPTGGLGEIREFVHAINLRTIGAEVTGSTTFRAGALSVTTTNIPTLATLVSEYGLVDFVSVELEVISTGGQDSTFTFWGAIVPDTAPLTTPVQDLGSAALLQARTGNTMRLEADFLRFDKAVVATRRTRQGLMFRVYFGRPTSWTAADFVVRIRGTVRCQDRVEA